MWLELGTFRQHFGFTLVEKKRELGGAFLGYDHHSQVWAGNYSRCTVHSGVANHAEPHSLHTVLMKLT